MRPAGHSLPNPGLADENFYAKMHKIEKSTKTGPNRTKTYTAYSHLYSICRRMHDENFVAK